jgi:hypothetical protein
MVWTGTTESNYIQHVLGSAIEAAINKEFFQSGTQMVILPTFLQWTI